MMSRRGLPFGRGAASAQKLWVLAAGLILLVGSVLGCATTSMVTMRPVPRNPLADTLHLTSRKGPQPSTRTMQFLRVYDLVGDLEGDPQALLQKAQAILDAQPSGEYAYVCAELAYLGAKRVEDRDIAKALSLYSATVLYAYRYLFDDDFTYLRNPYDPQFRGACDLYNTALESAMRIVSREEGIRPGQSRRIVTAAGEYEITCIVRGSHWRPEDFGPIEFVSDYEMRGLKNHYLTYGLGVPLIVVRRSYPGEPAAARYYPEGLSFAATAFLRPLPERTFRKEVLREMERGSPDGRVPGTGRLRALLELYDPLVTQDIYVAGIRVPLESDLTTPLAYFLSNPALGTLATTGLLRPEALQKLMPGQKKPYRGLWMVQPYEPGKIPVIFVHGLWSSPMTWMEMFNDLRSQPDIRAHYQFWFYLYPTGQPFWISAAQMRDDLAEARQILDPEGREPALDQMVLIGHSMGGLVSRLQTLESGEDFWHLISDHPFDQVQADPETKERIAKVLFFHPNPSVRRVITIATPHRGSKFSNDATQWILRKLIELPTLVLQSQEAFYRNNKHLFKDDRVLKIRTSVDSLSPDNPVFEAMIHAQRAPWVKYHAIIGLMPEKGLYGKLAKGTDGVVSYQSAHMDDVESELVVPADHSGVHSHPRAVLEVRRILQEHLDEVQGRIAYTLPVHVRMASQRQNRSQ